MQGELGSVESDAGLVKSIERRTVMELVQGGRGEMIALTLVEETTLVERTAESVGVALAAQVSGEFPPLDVGSAAVGVGEAVADDAAGFFHGVVAGVEVLVVAHVVDEDGQDVCVALD